MGQRVPGSLLCSGAKIRPETRLSYLRALICGASSVSHQSTHIHTHIRTEKGAFQAATKALLSA